MDPRKLTIYKGIIKLILNELHSCPNNEKIGYCIEYLLENFENNDELVLASLLLKKLNPDEHKLQFMDPKIKKISQLKYIFETLCKNIASVYTHEIDDYTKFVILRHIQDQEIFNTCDDKIFIHSVDAMVCLLDDLMYANYAKFY